MTAALVAGLLAGYGIAVPVGAIAALIVSLTARTSLRVGAAAALGVATADGIYALVAVLGGAALTGLIAPLAGTLRSGAAALLLALSVRTAWLAVRHYRAPRAAPRPRVGLHTPGRAFLGLLGLTLLNPATVVYFGTLVVGRRAAGGQSPATDAVFVAAAFVASASWQLLLAVGGSAVGTVLAGPRGRLVTALVSAAVIAALAVALVV